MFSCFCWFEPILPFLVIRHLSRLSFFLGFPVQFSPRSPSPGEGSFAPPRRQYALLLTHSGSSYAWRTSISSLRRNPPRPDLPFPLLALGVYFENEPPAREIIGLVHWGALLAF